VEKRVHRYWGYAISTLLLSACLATFPGCPDSSDCRRLWVFNQGDCAIEGVYVCSDPRAEEWGNNLLLAPIEADGFGVITTDILKDKPGWIWPYIEGQGLISVCAMPSNADIFILVARTDQGDYQAELLGQANSPVCARYLLE
jgi:hypothetical protein